MQGRINHIEKTENMAVNLWGGIKGPLEEGLPNLFLANVARGTLNHKITRPRLAWVTLGIERLGVLSIMVFRILVWNQVCEDLTRSIINPLLSF